MTYTWNLDPIAFSIFGLDVRWYGIAYLIAFLFMRYIGFWGIQKFLNPRISKKIKLPDFENLIFNGFFIGVIGGRLGEILFYHPEIIFNDFWEIFKIWHGGMSIHGGFILATLYGLYWVKKQQISFLELADVLVLPLSLGLAVGRMANFINGELYGRITNQNWGVIFPHVDEMLRHPSQLYEVSKNLVLASIILGLLFLKKNKKKDFPKGVIFGFFFLGYGILRFFIEYVREPERFIGVLTTGQFLCTLMIIFGSGIIFLAFSKKELKLK